MEINQEKIKQAILELHQRNPGKVLTTLETYQAIAQAQYKEDHKEATMELEKKLRILQKLDTKNLIDKIKQYEDEFEKAMTTQANFKNSNHQYLASTGDCSEVKRISAELAIQVPETSESGKKLIAADKENWLTRQRKENKELSEAIDKQRMVAFLIDDYQVKVEMAKKRLEGVKIILALKTAQINFLASN